MKFLGYSGFLFILPLIILVMATCIAVTILMWPKIKEIRKNIRDVVIRERRPLSQKEKENIKRNFIKDTEALTDTKGQKELLSELKNEDIKDLFRQEQKR
jgi:hypothetical protein